MQVSQFSNFDYELRERSAVEKIIVFKDPSVEPGYSGGPILGKAGTVVAVVIQRTADGECRATSIRPLLEHLELPSNASKNLI